MTAMIETVMAPPAELATAHAALAPELEPLAWQITIRQNGPNNELLRTEAAARRRG